MDISLQDVATSPWAGLLPKEEQNQYEISYQTPNGKKHKLTTTLSSPVTYFGMKYYDVTQYLCICFEKDMIGKIRDYVVSSVLLEQIGVANPGHIACTAQLVKDGKKVGKQSVKGIISRNPGGMIQADWRLGPLKQSSTKAYLDTYNDELVTSLAFIMANMLHISLEDVLIAHSKETNSTALYVNKLIVTRGDGKERYQQEASKVKDTVVAILMYLHNGDILQSQLDLIAEEQMLIQDENPIHNQHSVVTTVMIPKDLDERNQALSLSCGVPFPNRIYIKALIFAGINIYYDHSTCLIQSVMTGQDYFLRFIGRKRLEQFMLHKTLATKLLQAAAEAPIKDAIKFILLNDKKKTQGGSEVYKQFAEDLMHDVSEASTDVKRLYVESKAPGYEALLTKNKEISKHRNR